MKKMLKSISALLIAFTLFFGLVQPIAYADEGSQNPDSGDQVLVGSIVNGVSQKKTVAGQTELNTISNTIISWLWVISIIVTIVVIMVIGLKYIIGSTQEKAEYKKSLIPLVVGSLLIVSATTIVKVLFAKG